MFADNSREPLKAVTNVSVLLAELKINDPEAEERITKLNADRIKKSGCKPEITPKIFETEKIKKECSDEYEPLIDFEMEKKLG